MKAPKPLDLPAAIAPAFVKDTLAYLDEPDPIKRDGIAVRQLRALREHQGPLFAQMKDHTTFSTGRRGH
jgi:hypothetical protein